MLLAAGIIILVLLLVLILKSNFLPGNIMALVPLIVAILLGLGFENTLKMAHKGILDVAAIVVLFIFASIFFGVVSDAGMFDPIIKGLMKSKWIGKSIFSVVCIAGIIAMAAHIDGQGVTTLIVTVPPMLIVFDKLHIKRSLLAMVFVLVTGSLDVLPWAGPVSRAATVTGIDVMVLFKALLPTMALGLILSFSALFIESRKEQKLGEFVPADGTTFGEMKSSEEETALYRPKMFWFNITLTVLVVVLLFAGMPPHITFLAGCGIVLPMNYRTGKEQNKRIKEHSGDILVSACTFIGAGIMLGIMEGGGIFTALGEGIAGLIPDALSPFIHFIFGVFVTPLSWLLNTDAMIYGIMPVIIKVGAESGISATKITAMIIAGRVMGTGLCLTTPSVYLGLGMMGLNYKDTFMRLAKWSFIIGEIVVIFTGIVVQ